MYILCSVLPRAVCDPAIVSDGNYFYGISFETFPVECHAGDVWTVSRARTEACRLSGHFWLGIPRLSNLGLFRFPFQRVVWKEEEGGGREKGKRTIVYCVR